MRTGLERCVNLWVHVDGEVLGLHDLLIPRCYRFINPNLKSVPNDGIDAIRDVSSWQFLHFSGLCWKRSCYYWEIPCVIKHRICAQSFEMWNLNRLHRRRFDDRPSAACQVTEVELKMKMMKYLRWLTYYCHGLITWEAR